MGWLSAAIAHTRVSRNFSPGPARHGQFNRTFFVGLTGAAMASLGLFALSRAAELTDQGRAEFKAASGRQPLARAFRADVEVVAFNLPQIRFRNAQRQGDSK
jgi:hypothetical protein